MNVISTAKAKTVASSWHDGQLSALYQFASSGIYMIENHLKYLQEIVIDLNPECWPHPGKLSTGDEKELVKLKQYIVHQGEKNGIKTNWRKHPKYKSGVPFIDATVPAELIKKIHPVRYFD